MYKGKKAVFLKKKQKRFIVTAQKKLNWTNFETARFLKVTIRTVADWKREKFLMPFAVVKQLGKKSGVRLPKIVELREQYWYTKKGARLGGLNSYRKQGGIIGDPRKRKVRWRVWWETFGKYQMRPIFRRFPFKKPARSLTFAEFIGIMMGDGGISKRQITITLHHIDDLLYSRFVARLMKKLFGIMPSIYHDAQDSVNNLVISRSGLVQYLHTLGLPIGNKVKQRFDMPSWIKRNRRFRIACVRGLVDTDGSVFTHRYKVNGKWYSYKKLSFASSSPPLRKTVFDILKEVGLHPRFSQDTDVRLDSIADLKKYFQVIGSHNPKHLKRYHE